MVFEDDENDEIVDGSPEYSRKSDFNKPKLVEEAFRKCLELRAKEMTAGYTNTTSSNDGTILRQRVEDTRQAFCNSVKALRSLLFPEIRRNDKVKKKLVSLNNKEKKLLEKYSYRIPIDPESSSDLKIKFSKDSFLPQNDDVLKSYNYSYSSKGLTLEKGFWNTCVNAYWNLLVKYRDRMLEQLSLLVDEANYFKQASSY